MKDLNWTIDEILDTHGSNYNTFSLSAIDENGKKWIAEGAGFGDEIEESEIENIEEA